MSDDDITSRDLTRGNRLRSPKKGILVIVERDNGKIYLEDGSELRVAEVVRDINKGDIEFLPLKSGQNKALLSGD